LWNSSFIEIKVKDFMDEVQLILCYDFTENFNLFIPLIFCLRRPWTIYIKKILGRIHTKKTYTSRKDCPNDGSKHEYAIYEL
jgi:hypothetical protein